MCCGCWEKHYGSVALDTPAIRAAAAIIRDVMDDHPTGSIGHIVLDDWNLEDEHIDWCIALYRKELIFDWDTEERDPIVLDALMSLKFLTLDERASAMARYEGCVK